MSEKLDAKYWNEVKAADAEVEERKKRLNHLKKRAVEKPNAPFVLIEGKGYVEVPAGVAAKLTEPGVSLGFPIGLEFARESFKYLEEKGFIRKQDWLKVKWAGTAEEALKQVLEKEGKRHKLPS